MRELIELDLSSSTPTEQEPERVSLSGEYRFLNVRSLTGTVKFRDPASGTFVALREGESWECFEPPFQVLEFAGDGAADLMVDTHVRVNPSGGGGGQSRTRDLIAMFHRSTIGASTAGISTHPDANVGSNPGGTGASVAGGIRNSLDGMHLINAASADDFCQVTVEVSAPHIPFPSIFNNHGYGAPAGPDYMIWWRDSVVVSDYVLGAADSYAVFGLGYWDRNGSTGALTLRGLFFQASTSRITGGVLPWRALAQDNQVGWSAFSDDLGNPSAEKIHRLGIGVGYIGGVPTARWEVDGEVLAEATADDFGEFGRSGNMNPIWHTEKNSGDSVESIEMAAVLGAGAELVREEY